MATPLLTLSGVCKYYTGSQSVVMGLSSIDLCFRRGEFVAVTGESGSGKSTLSHVLGGILPYESGEMYLNGAPTSHYDSADWERYRRDNISFISQNYGILPGATVLSNVVTALRLAGMDARQARREAQAILEQVELWELRSRRAAKLSSGQKQRLSIARALAKPAPILIADEPTGNLDPENSAKVIRLLAQAARKRLVILVTHEFSEAEDFATRRIVLQDGRVVMDASLRPANTPDAPPAAAPRAKKSGQSGLAARVQLSSRPVWCTLMGAFFALTTFAVFAFLGNFIMALDDTSTRIYDSSAFLNGSPERIVVTTLEGRNFTEEDYAVILSLPYVERLEPNGYVTDIQYAYRNGIDYTTVRSEAIADGENVLKTSYHMKSSAPFLQTVPRLPDGRAFLTDGHLPENFFEVVAQGDASQIGSTVSVFITDAKTWGQGIYLDLKMTIVGVTDVGTGLYFHEDLGRMFASHQISGYNFYILPEQYDPADPSSGQLTDELFRCSASIADDRYAKYIEYNPDGTPKPLVIDFPNINVLYEDPQGTSAEAFLSLILASTVPQTITTPEGQSQVIYPRADHHYLYDRVYEFSMDTFRKLTWQGGFDQLSLTISDYAYTDRVLSGLQKLGYIAVSPYQQGSTRVNTAKAAQRMQTLAVCLGAMIAVAVLEILLLRAMFSGQMENYRLLSNLGLTRKAAGRSLLLQILALTLVGQLLGAGAIVLCVWQGIPQIANVAKYLPWQKLLPLCVLHLALGLLGASSVIRMLNKQVYPMAKKYEDLSMDTETEAAL